jgi:ferredoxin
MTQRMLVDWPSCRARGLCAELLPELVTLDEWGYPVVHGDVDEDRRRLAQEAVAACPHLALRLVPSADR